MLLLACGGLTACGVTRDYKQPDIAFPDSYRGGKPGIKGGPADSSVAMLPYQSFFSDKTLRELIDTAIAHNIDLQVALKNIDYAKEGLGAARLGLLPTLNLQVQNTNNSPSDNGLQSYKNDYTASGVMTWEADIWGKIRSKKKSALATYLKTEKQPKPSVQNWLQM